tara:strand:+ start:468 stop:833 length:366 start_codon:yes stop_codon:yes gene_type:complete
MSRTVAIIGASDNEERYSYLAQKLLMEEGYRVVPISPLGKTILGVKGYRSLSDYDGGIDTVTMYVGPSRQEAVVASILAKAPRYILFNPGTENAEVERSLIQAGIVVERACTLVLLRIGKF